MARPTDWDVLDMGGDPTPGDPGRVRQLANRFHDFAETAHRAKLAVESLQGDGAVLTWVGLSGDAFREHFGEFPTQVNKLYQSHLMVGDALQTYAPVLETAQAQADRALADGRAAAEKLRALQGGLSTAEADFTGASQQAQQARAESQQPDPEQVKQAVRDADAAQQRVTAAQGLVTGAQQELDLAKQLAEQARQMRDGAARTCTREIDDASDAGIQPRSFWQKLGDALKELWNIICEVAKWVALVAGVIAMIIGGPLAWVALAAGAILLVKAIVDYSQGKGSVLDLVFGILGVIPGVKGLTSLSKLSALYKAGGVKEIAKATLTGMKNLARDMVGLVKAAGAGALTVVKKLGDGTVSALAAVKTAGVVLTDAVRLGAKLGDLPPPRGADRGFGAVTLPPLPVGTGQRFAQRFADLATLKTTTEGTELAKIRADFAAKFQAEKLAIEQKFANQLAIKKSDLKTAYDLKLQNEKLPIETRYTNDLATKTGEIKLDYGKQLDVRKGELDVKYDALRAAKTTEVKNLHLADHQLKLDPLTQTHDAQRAALRNQLSTYDQQAAQHASGLDPASFPAFMQNYTTNLRPTFINNLDNQAAGLKTTFDNDVANLQLQTQKLHDADLANSLAQLDGLKAGEIVAAEKHFGDLATADIAKATQELDNLKATDLGNLTARLDGERAVEVSTATADLNKLELAEIKVAEGRLDGLRDTELVNAQASIDNHFAGLDQNLRTDMLNAVGTDIPMPGQPPVKLVHSASGADPADLGTVVDKNWTRLDEINPNKNAATDVNCTICVQRVDDYVKNGTIATAPKIPTMRPLTDIEANYPGNTFTQIPNADYRSVLAQMAATPDNTVGIIGYRGQSFGGGGHVLNVVNMGGGRVAVVDGQAGGLGFLPGLNPATDELWFMRLP